MMSFPQLPPLEPTRPESEQLHEEVWHPDWRCFCCQDTGIVNPHLARLVISNYVWQRDRLPICQAPKCGKSSRWLHLGNNNLDMRFISTICQQLDMYNREDWRLTVERKVFDLQALVQKRSISGILDRTFNDNREIQQRKAEIEAITSEQWAVMAHAYKGEDDEA